MIWTIGDIHGMADSLKILISKIEEIGQISADKKIERLVFTGDYIDRGPASKEVIDIIMGLKYDKITLAGNHEDMMLGALEGGTKGEDSMRNWLYNGGQTAIASFMPELKPEPLNRNIAPGAFRLEKKYMDFFEGLGLSHTEDIGGIKFAFAHAGFPPGADIHSLLKIKTRNELNALIEIGIYNFDDTMLWTREKGREKFAGFVIVHGHSIVLVPQSSERYDENSGSPYIRFEGAKPDFIFAENKSVVWKGGASFDKIISINVDTGAVREKFGKKGYLTAIGISEDGVKNGTLQSVRASMDGRVFHEEIRLIK